MLQVMKIAVAPTVMVLEFGVYQKVPTLKVVASVLLVCLGVGVATVTDTQMARNIKGLLIGLAATAAAAIYQVSAGCRSWRAGQEATAPGSM